MPRNEQKDPKRDPYQGLFEGMWEDLARRLSDMLNRGFTVKQLHGLSAEQLQQVLKEAENIV